MTKDRLEAFSDGVFAIAITLLVIELRPPEPHEGESLARALWDLWPGYLAYLLSFIVIGVMWLNHHRMFEQVRNVDGVLLVLNLYLLLWMALIPFPTAVVAEYLREGGDDARTATAFYSGVLLMAAIAFSAMYAWILRDARVTGMEAPPEVVRTARVRFGIGVLFYVIAIGLAFVSAYASLALNGALALYYLFDQATVTPPDEPT